MTDLILMRGLPASGKTTASKAIMKEVARTGRQTFRVSRDDIRQQMGIVDENLVTKVEDMLVELYMSQKPDAVIVDATHLRPSYIRRWQKKYSNVIVREHDVDPETCIARDALRENPVGEDVIRNMVQKYMPKGKFLPIPEYSEGNTPNNPQNGKFLPLPPSERIRPDAYIFDIDGTLAHMDGKRSPYDYDKAVHDRLDLHVKLILDTLRFDSNKDIVIVSGRSEDSRHVTERWLLDNNVYYDALFMRASGDNRKDDLVKYEIYRDHIHDNWEVLGVFDDRNQVIKMWREIGLKCFQVEDGDF